MFRSSRRFTALRSTRELIESTRPQSKRRVAPPRRCSCSRQLPIRFASVALGILLLPAAAWAYRPFVSTDAVVADPREVEIELGYFNLEHAGHQNRITIPSLVLNYGVAPNWEAVAEFSLQANPGFELTDPGLFLKGVLREGVLQDKPGVSVAIEAGPLLPSTLPHEQGVGFEAIGIASGKLAPVTVHVNAGGGLDRDDRHGFAVWGVIGELPVHSGIRLVGEANGESTQGAQSNIPELLGGIGPT